MRYPTLVLAALALTMTSAHVLEMPQKLAYGPRLYAAVNRLCLTRTAGLLNGPVRTRGER